VPGGASPALHEFFAPFFAPLVDHGARNCTSGGPAFRIFLGFLKREGERLRNSAHEADTRDADADHGGIPLAHVQLVDFYGFDESDEFGRFPTVS
jgi:hypothetical protein